MDEKRVQSLVKKKLIEAGYLVVKIMSCSLPGWPDLQAHKNGKIIFIECKAPGKKPTPLQAYRHENLRAIGFEVWVIDDVKDLEI
jgi:Holliday junction resolvase